MRIRPTWIAFAFLFAFALTLQPAADARSKPTPNDLGLVPAVNSVVSSDWDDLSEGDVCGVGSCSGQPLGLVRRLNPVRMLHNKKPLRRLLFRKAR